jgi:hypothetical protein
MLQKRLEGSRLVASQDVAAAAEVMLAKSEVKP